MPYYYAGDLACGGTLLLETVNYSPGMDRVPHIYYGYHWMDHGQTATFSFGLTLEHDGTIWRCSPYFEDIDSGPLAGNGPFHLDNEGMWSAPDVDFTNTGPPRWFYMEFESQFHEAIFSIGMSNCTYLAEPEPHEPYSRPIVLSGSSQCEIGGWTVGGLS